MKAKQLAAILMKRPDLEVEVSWTEMVSLSELTTDEETQQEPIGCIGVNEGKLVITAETYLGADECLWRQQ